MDLRELMDGISCLSIRSALIGLRNPSKLRQYVSHCLRRYDEFLGHGLPPASPVSPPEDMTVTIPPIIRVEEWPLMNLCIWPALSEF